MHLVVLSLLAAAASANPAWWWFTAWDGLSCGASPQYGQEFFSTEGIGEQFCINFDQSQRAYSYAATFSSDSEVEARGYLYEHCEGPSKVLVNNTCTNPDMEIPYIRSWRIYNVEE